MASAAEFAARTTILKTRVNDTELGFIARKASARGVSVGAYLRIAALQRREQRSSQLVIELQRLNAQLLENARLGGKSLNLVKIADDLASLMQLAESGAIE
jgi:hypothetical protein